MRRTIKITEEKRKYFEDLDRSILNFSVDLGRAVLQVDGLKSTLATLYQSRQNHMNQQLAENGVVPTELVGAAIDPETGDVIVELRDPPAAPSNGS